MFLNEEYKVQKHFIDLVLAVHKLGIEIDECAHIDRSETEEKERQELTERETGFKIIRINPYRENFDIFDEIGEIQSFIIESTKKITEQSTKKSLVDDAEKLSKMVKNLCL